MLITGDASPLGQATRQGSNFVRQFERESGNSLATVGSATKKFATAMNTSFQSPRSMLMGVAGLMAGGPTAIATAAGLATAAVTAFAAEGVRAAATMEQMRADTVRAFQESAAAIGEFEGKFVDTTNTVQGRSKATGDAIRAHLAGHAEPVMDPLRAGLGGLAKLIEGSSRGFGFTTAGKFKEEIDGLKEATEWNEKLLRMEKVMEDARAANRKKAREEQDKLNAAMKRQADEMAKSVRTPLEAFVDSMREAQKLLDKGLIKDETFERMREKLRAELLQATKPKDTFRERGEFQTAAAVERNTMAGFSAAIRNALASRQREDIERRQLQVEQQQLEVLRRAEEHLRNNKGVQLTTVNHL